MSPLHKQTAVAQKLIDQLTKNISAPNEQANVMIPRVNRLEL